MPHYPVQNRNSRNQVARPTQGSILPPTGGVIPNIFQQQTSHYAFRDGRAHCQSIERTAIYTDAQGNRVVLKEHTTTMNTDNNGPGLRFTDGGREFRKHRP